MNKFRKKPVVIDAMTFNEMLEYGRQHCGPHMHDGMPWSFDINGYAITHENDERYIISTLEGSHNMTPKDMLLIGIKGEIYPCKLDIFEATYEKVEETPNQRHLRKLLEQSRSDKAIDKRGNGRTE